jgi:hypothetical protein
MLWSIPCLVSLMLTQYACRAGFLNTTWQQWLFVALLSAPAAYELVYAGAQMPALWHRSPLPLPSLRRTLAYWMSTDPLETVLWFTYVVYSLIAGLGMTVMLMELLDRQGPSLFLYPFVVGGLLLGVPLTASPMRRAVLLHALERPRPFTINHLRLTPREQIPGFWLEYSLTIPQLPQEHVLYELCCTVYDGKYDINAVVRDPRSVAMIFPWDTHHITQIDGTISTIGEGAASHDDLLVHHRSLHGTIAIPSTILPRYLLVSIGFLHALPNIKKTVPVDVSYYQWYLVSLTESSRKRLYNS